MGGTAFAGEASRDDEARNAGANYGDAEWDGEGERNWVDRDHREQEKQGNISHERADVTVVDAWDEMRRADEKDTGI
jgi:hypothetical protein